MQDWRVAGAVPPKEQLRRQRRLPAVLIALPGQDYKNHTDDNQYGRADSNPVRSLAISNPSVDITTA
jgi:hypothetical protein